MVVEVVVGTATVVVEDEVELVVWVDDDAVVVLVVVVDELVVVVTRQPPDALGKTVGSAGSGPQSSSRRAKMPSSSRATPMRTPKPSGTQVYVCSWPAPAATAR